MDNRFCFVRVWFDDIEQVMRAVVGDRRNARTPLRTRARQVLFNSSRVEVESIIQIQICVRLRGRRLHRPGGDTREVVGVIQNEPRRKAGTPPATLIVVPLAPAQVFTPARRPVGVAARIELIDEFRLDARFFGADRVHPAVPLLRAGSFRSREEDRELSGSRR